MGKTSNIVAYRYCRGLSLVELMIASAIGLLMLGAVVSLFLSTKVSYTDSERMSAMYSNGRYGLSMLAEELRLVDFWGPTRASNITNHAALDAIASDCSGSAAGYDLANALWATTASAATVATCITDAAINSDVLFVKHAAPTETAVADIDSDLTYVMSNDTVGVLFDGADTAPSTTTGGVVPGGTAWELQVTAYYVSNEEPPVLYRKQLQGNTWAASEEVASGIERLRVLFGQDTNNDGIADTYSNAADATWGNVVSARVYLLVRSEQSDGKYTDEKTYQLGDVTVDPAANDHFHRIVFDTSVSVRNRRLLITGGF